MFARHSVAFNSGSTISIEAQTRRSYLAGGKRTREPYKGRLRTFYRVAAGDYPKLCLQSMARCVRTIVRLGHEQ